jgi:hypothetical protein
MRDMFPKQMVIEPGQRDAPTAMLARSADHRDDARSCGLAEKLNSDFNLHG